VEELEIEGQLLKKNIKKTAPVEKGKKFSIFEDEIILQGIRSVGKRWDLIAAQLPGRTPSMIKNRYYYALKNTMTKYPGKLELDSLRVPSELSTTYAEEEMGVSGYNSKSESFNDPDSGF